MVGAILGGWAAMPTYFMGARRGFFWDENNGHIEYSSSLYYHSPTDNYYITSRYFPKLIVSDVM